jgi:hypothetical protein
MYDEDNPDHVRRCRELNDTLRKSLGLDDVKNRTVLTAGLCQLGPQFVARTLIAVRDFSDFNEYNDPYGEHDFITVEVEGQKVMAKVDYYDNNIKYHSPDKSDPAVTVRVLTIMLACEY